jgi:hypothetical protein
MMTLLELFWSLHHAKNQSKSTRIRARELEGEHQDQNNNTKIRARKARGKH